MIFRKQRSTLWLYAGLLCILFSGFQAAFGQIRPPEQVQMEFHRAQTAWRNQTSILEAKVRVDNVLRDAPNHAEAWKLRAEVFIAMERYEEALRDAERATVLAPKDGDGFLILAEAARLNNNVDLARNSLKKASNLAIDGSPDFHIKLSRSAVLLGESDLNMAESFARVGKAEHPDYAEAYYQLARVFVLQNRLDDAVITLTSGFEAELLDPAYIGFDATLHVLTTHPGLSDYIKN